ncbi:MAG: dCTP deaminase [Lachnospiraceae bacterium]|nr:dCTP deaminase [Lachnospiraceae bacterium]
MIISGKKIRELMGKDIFIDPFDEQKLNTNSYNLSLNNKLKVYKNSTLDMKADNESYEITIPEDGFIIYPNELYLGTTLECTYTEKYIPMLEGRSSIARLGIFVHITAGLGEAGFHGRWTLELTCVKPIRIYPYVNICQIYYQEIAGEIELCHSTKYQNSFDASTSQLFKEF